jgi:hypothetical protein
LSICAWETVVGEEFFAEGFVERLSKGFVADTGMFGLEGTGRVAISTLGLVLGRVTLIGRGTVVVGRVALVVARVTPAEGVCGLVADPAVFVVVEPAKIPAAPNSKTINKAAMRVAQLSAMFPQKRFAREVPQA